MSLDELNDFLAERLGICGCSDNDDSVLFVLDLLEAGWMRSEGHVDEADALIANLLPQGDCLERNLPVYWLSAAGLVEHGWEIHTYTLTPRGTDVLLAIKAAMEDQEDDLYTVWN